MNNLIIPQPIENSNDRQNQPTHSISGSADIRGVKISITAKGYAANDSALPPKCEAQKVLQAKNVEMTTHERKAHYGEHISLISANCDLVKNLITGDSYPLVKNVTSYEISVKGNLPKLYEVIVLAAEAKMALMTSHFKRPLKNESRADQGLDGDTQLLILDIDSDIGFQNREEFINWIFNGKKVPFIFQHSARSEGDEDVCGHYFILLNEPVSRVIIQKWIVRLNHQLYTLQGVNIAKTDSGKNIKWAVDICVNSAKRIIYLGAPICENDSVKQRVILYGEGRGDMAKLECGNINIDDLTNEIREQVNLDRQDVYHHFSQTHYRSGSGVQITEIKRKKLFISLNLNGGDSLGYYICRSNPAYIRNFKSEPWIPLYDVDRSLYNRLVAQHLLEKAAGLEKPDIRAIWCGIQTVAQCVSKMSGIPKERCWETMRLEILAEIMTSFVFSDKGRFITVTNDGDARTNAFTSTELEKELMRRYPKSVVNISKVIEHSTLEEPINTGKLMQSCNQALIVALKGVRQYVRINYNTDIWCRKSRIKIPGNGVAEFIVKHERAPEGDYDQVVIDDYKQHFPQLDDILKIMAAARVSESNRRAMLWLNCPSSWGKGFFMDALKSLGCTARLNEDELKILFSGKPCGRIPDEFLNIWVLHFDESKYIGARHKELTDWILMTPKYVSQSYVKIGLKIITTAEMNNTVTSEGVEDQFAERMSYIKNTGTLASRKMVQKLGLSEYRNHVTHYCGRFLNREISRYLKLNPVDAKHAAYEALEQFHSKYGIEHTFGRLSQGLATVHDDILSWWLEKFKNEEDYNLPLYYQDDELFMKTEDIGHMVERYLDEKSTRDTRVTFGIKRAEISDSMHIRPDKNKKDNRMNISGWKLSPRNKSVENFNKRERFVKLDMNKFSPDTLSAIKGIVKGELQIDKANLAFVQKNLTQEDLLN